MPLPKRGRGIIFYNYRTGKEEGIKIKIKFPKYSIGENKKETWPFILQMCEGQCLK